MKFLFIWILMLPALGFAHGNHGAGLDGLFSELAEHGLILHSRPAGTGSFVKLADGSKVTLDSKFFASAASFLDSDTAPEPPTKNGPIAWMRERLGDLARKSFWVELGADGSEAFTRYGAFTFTLIVAAEFVEHSLLPGPGFCVAVQAGCTIFSQQLRELWTGARYAEPSALPFRERIKASARILLGKFDFWRAMRTVLTDQPLQTATTKRQYKKHFRRHTSVEDLLLDSPFWGVLLTPDVEKSAPTFGNCDHLDHFFGATCQAVDGETAAGLSETFLRPLDVHAPRALRVVMAQEQLAYLELTLAAARSASRQLITRPRAFFKMRSLIARLGKAQDSYGFALRRIAEMEAPLAKHQEFVEQFLAEYISQYRHIQKYFVGLKGGISAGSLPVEWIRGGLAKLNQFAKAFLRTGDCSADLMGR